MGSSEEQIDIRVAHGVFEEWSGLDHSDEANPLIVEVVLIQLLL